MICTQCEGVISEGATECPYCGAAVAEAAAGEPASTGVAPAPGATPGPPGAQAGPPGAQAEPPGATPAPPGAAAGSATSFKFEARRWSQADRIAAIATVVLFISLFLPWFSVSFAFVTASASGLTAHGFLYIVLLICLAIFAYLVARAGFEEMPFKIPVGHEPVLLIATVVNLVLVLIALIDKPYGSGVGWSYGGFLALIAAVIAAAPVALPAIGARSKPTK